jgi:hypothetical protein
MSASWCGHLRENPERLVLASGFGAVARGVPGLLAGVPGFTDGSARPWPV